MNEFLIVPLYEDLGLRGCQVDTRSGSVSYVAAAVSGLVVAVLWIAGRDQLLRMAIPAMAMLTAVALYFTRPMVYIQYALWVWFLSPLVRRIVDWRFGYADPNFVLIAPLLVSAVAGITLLTPSRRAGTRIPVVFVLCGSAIVYGFMVGMVLHPSAETVYGLCNWLCPMLFGLHLFLNWRQYEEQRAAISNTFLWGVLILGLYGIYQYFSPPVWDRYWLESIMLGGGSESFGRPEPLQVRVWSTMNSPGPFANVMLAGLLVLFAIRWSWKLPALVAGYLALLLSLVRTAWMSWFLGLFVLLRKSTPRVIVRVLVLIIVLGVCLVPLVNDSRLADVLGDRVETLSDVGHDESFQERLDMYRAVTNDAMANPFGHGLKNQEVVKGFAVDSGILAMVFSLGWVGTLVFSVGMLSFFLKKQQARMKNDMFSRATKAIVIALGAQVVGGNIFVSVSGAILWIFAGMYLSADQRYSDRSIAVANEMDA